MSAHYEGLEVSSTFSTAVELSVGRHAESVAPIQNAISREFIFMSNAHIKLT